MHVTINLKKRILIGKKGKMNLKKYVINFVLKTVIMIASFHGAAAKIVAL
jgi:hypothetical protein